MTRATTSKEPPLLGSMQPTTGAQLGALVRALSVTAGRAALRRSLPLYLALVIASIMIFEGNGLEPAALLAMMRESTLLRVVMWSAWLLVTTPAAVAALASPSSFGLRSLPIPRWQSYLVQGAFMLVIELPWLALWTRGGGVGPGVGAMATALCAHGLIVARLRRWPERMLAVVVAVVVVAPAPAWATVSMLPVGVFALRLAWLRAPERGRAPDLPVVAGPPTVALALAHAATFVRGHGAVVIRAVLFTALASLLASLALLNGEDLDASRRVTLATGFIAPAAIIAGASLSGPLRSSEDRARWLLASLGVPHRLERDAGLLALAGTTTALGLTHGLVVALATGASWGAAAWVVVSAGLVAAVLSGLSSHLARIQQRPVRMVASQILLTAIAIGSTWLLGSWTAPTWAATAVFMTALGRARAAPSGTSSLGAGAGADDVEPQPPLRVREVSKRLGRRQVLDAVSLEGHASEVVVVTGENGAGKSTLLRIIAGLIEPDHGTVHVGGDPVQGGGVAARRRLGYVPDTMDAFAELMVRELVELTRVLKRVPLSDHQTQLRSRLGLEGVWNQRLSTLSFGQRKRACVLTALLGAPPLLVLDEPSNGLDPEGVQAMLELIESRQVDGAVTLLSTNDPSFAGAVAGTNHHLEGGHLIPGPTWARTRA